MISNVLKPPYRAATLDDTPAMAELVNIAGEGLPHYLWANMADEKISPWDIGQQRARRESGAFSYRNTVIHEVGSRVVAALIGYPLPVEPQVDRFDDLPQMFVPLQQLEDLVPATWYINALATYSEHRGKGYGTELLSIAGQLAAQQACRGLSLIVSDANSGALRLYERLGFEAIDSRPMLKDSWENPGKHWVLLARMRRVGEQATT